MRVLVHRVQHRQPRPGHPQVGLTQQLLEVRRRGHTRSLTRFLESVKNKQAPLVLGEETGEQPYGMVIGMAKTQKVTITLSTQSVEAIQALVAQGKSDSVSGFVQHAVHVSLDDIAGWGAMLAEALRETGGEITPAERAWADQVLGRSGRHSAA